MPYNLIFDFDKESDKRQLFGVLKTLKGRNRVELSKFRPRRSDKQNSYYWGVVVPYAQRALQETQGDEWSPERTHEFLKGRFLAEPIVDRKTGELISTVVGSSAVLDTAQFTDYVEKVRQWVAEYAGVVVPDPESMQFA